MYLNPSFSFTTSGFNSDFLLAQPGNKVLHFADLTSEAAITKLDGTGNLIWSRTYHFSSSANLPTKFTDAINVNDSAVVAVGKAKINNIAYLGFCLKLKTNGDTAWCRRIVCNTDSTLVPRSISLTLDSGYIICGAANATSPNGSSNIGFVARLTKNGGLTWIKLLNNSIDAYTVKPTIDSGYVLTGASGGLFQRCVTLLKLDKYGNFTWQKIYGDKQPYTMAQATGHDLVVDQTGYFCLSRSTSGGAILLKTDLNGNKLWAKCYKNLSTYPNDDSPRDRPMGMLRLSKNSLLLTNKFDGLSGNWTMSVDTLGEVLWYASSFMQDINVVQLQNKNLVIMGQRIFRVDVLPVTPGNIGMIVIDSLGSSSSSCYALSTATAVAQVIDTASVAMNLSPGGNIFPITGTVSLLNLVVEPGCMLLANGFGENSENSPVNVFPNPANDKININTETSGNLTFELSDASGRIVLTNTLKTEIGETAIEIGRFAPGLYIYSVWNGPVLMSRDKLIIRN